MTRNGDWAQVLPVRNRTARIRDRGDDRHVHRHSDAKKSPSATLADLKRELGRPRVAKSAKTAKNLLITRIPEHPSITMPGTVEKIIPAKNPSRPEKADISVDGAPPHQVLRVENTLTDEHGDEVRLKKGAHVEITVADEASGSKRGA
jgi:hypothetical protein